MNYKNQLLSIYPLINLDINNFEFVNSFKPKIYFYEWYNNSVMYKTSKNTPQYLKLPIITNEDSIYSDDGTVPDEYNRLVSVNYLKQYNAKGGSYNKIWFDEYYQLAQWKSENVSNTVKDLYKDKKGLLSFLQKKKITIKEKIFIDLLNIGIKYKKTFNTSKQYLNDLNIDLYHEKGYLYKIKLNEGDNVILFGDYHGSYHTFYRNMLRLEKKNIIKYNSLNEPVLNDGYILLFLGDILDRGLHTTEILIFILLLIKNSNKKKQQIIINRGNHETEEVYSYEYIRREFLKKFSNNDNILSNKLKQFFGLCPSGVFLQTSNNKNIFCCHGLLDMSISKSIKTDFIETEKKHLNLDVKENADNIRWSDIEVSENKFLDIKKKVESFNNEYKGECVYNLNRGGGGNLCFYENVEKYLTENNISLIIRGHQDNNANTVLAFSEPHKSYKFEFTNGDSIQTFLSTTDSKIINTKTEPIEGALGIYDINTSSIHTYYNGEYKDIIGKPVKVITLSTNNDLKRPYDFNDSMAILTN